MSQSTLFQNLVEIVTSTGGLTLIALFFGVSLFVVACELVASPLHSTDMLRRIESDNPIDDTPDNSDW